MIEQVYKVSTYPLRYWTFVLVTLLTLLAGCQPVPAVPLSITSTAVEVVQVASPTAPPPTTTSPPTNTVTRTVAPSLSATARHSSTPAPTATLASIPNEFNLTVPPGVSVELVATGLSNPTSLAFDESGALYVGVNNGIYPMDPVGAIYRFDGVLEEGGAEPPTRFADELVRPVGLAFRDGELYVSSFGKVQAMRDSNGDGVADEIRPIIEDLPVEGHLHHNSSLAFGPDGLLYLTLGSATNNGPEANPFNATILRSQRDGSGLEVYASGMRNPFDLAWDAAGNLFATDNGCDPPACIDAPEELNHVIQGADYGFPDYVGAPPADSGTQGPIATFGPHTSANGLIVYDGAMFPEWQGHLFVALFGSYLEGFTDVGHRVLRVELRPDGESFQATVHPFAEGFDRPLDLVVAPDGSILVADFEGGRVYRLYRELGRD
jgi:glucose/arabinose dehydrogenase